MPPSSIAYALVLALMVAAFSVAAHRLRFASPLLMLVVGSLFAFIPGMPAVVLDPDLVFLVFLPPLLYSAGVGMSWRGFRSNLRPILLLAVGCVLFTATAVAAVVHYALGLPWSLGFVLGAIVSPPDAVAPMAVLRTIGLPRRLITVLKGESLVNDATALVAFSFALAAAVTNQLLAAATIKFVIVVAGEIGFGIAVAWLMLRLRRLANEPRAEEVLLAFTTPALAFWPPHVLGGSGVVACVAAGLYVSWNGRRLIGPATRLQDYHIKVSSHVGIEALVFLLTGLQAYTVIQGLSGDGWTRALWAGVLTSIHHHRRPLHRVFRPNTCRG